MIMKQVISGNELRKKIDETIDLLCGTVKQTLGPKGNNVIISNSSFSILFWISAELDNSCLPKSSSLSNNNNSFNSFKLVKSSNPAGAKE